MNAFSTLWKGIVDELNANKVQLGIEGAERAESGKVTALIPPSVAVWLDIQAATITSQKGAVRFPVDVIIYCVATPDILEADAVDNALEIAKKILHHLNNIEISGVVLVQPDNEPVIEVVERTSSQAVVGVLLKAEVVL